MYGDNFYAITESSRATGINQSLIRYEIARIRYQLSPPFRCEVLSHCVGTSTLVPLFDNEEIRAT